MTMRREQREPCMYARTQQKSKGPKRKAKRQKVPNHQMHPKMAIRQVVTNPNTRRQHRHKQAVSVRITLQFLALVSSLAFVSLVHRTWNFHHETSSDEVRLHGLAVASTPDVIDTTSRSKQHQRIVMLVGPHKSASTSVQTYLVKLAKENILQQYNWSWIGNNKGKGFSEASRHVLFNSTKGEYLAAYLKMFARHEWKKGNNLILAAEFMDYVAALPEQEAQKSIQSLMDWIPARPSTNNNAEAVVMYRSPRSSHLISIWKQQVGFRKTVTVSPWRESLFEGNIRRKAIQAEPPTLAQWLCTGEWDGVMRYNVSTILAAQLNPFGVAHSYHKYGGADITIVDMSGVPNGDIPSSIVCSVLGMPCTDEGRLDASTHVVPKQKNKKKAQTDLGMSDEDLQQAEQIIRDMDCHYYCKLGVDISILHSRDEVFSGDNWKGCCRRSKKHGDKQIDGSKAAELLRELGCRSSKRLSD